MPRPHVLCFRTFSTSYSSSSLIIVGGDAGFLYCPLNFGSTHRVKRSSLKTLWIIQLSGSSSWNAPKPMSFMILKGPYLLLSNFFEGQFDWIFLFSNHTCSPTFRPWEFLLLLSNCFFMLLWLSFIACVACFQLSCNFFTNSSTRGNSVCTMRSPFQGCLPKFSSNGVFPVAACFLSL